MAAELLSTFFGRKPAMHAKSFSKGFTLVELLIVIAVISILAAVAIPAYYNHILRVRQADAHNELLDIKAAEEMFYSQYNEYAAWSALTPDGTFSALLSFNIADSTYYVYTVTTNSGGAGYIALATGQNNTKFDENVIEMTEDTDPDETNEPVGFKLSLLFE